MAGRLALAEAECLPFDDATFDACWSIGGFTYYRDHEAALREMRRVTRPGAPVVVADEIHGLHRAGLGHSLGIPSFDAWWLGSWVSIASLSRWFIALTSTFERSPNASGRSRLDTDLARARVLSCEHIE